MPCRQRSGSSGRKTIVGYNDIANPIYQHARQLVMEGAIGKPIHFRGFVDEEYQADPRQLGCRTD